MSDNKGKKFPVETLTPTEVARLLARVTRATAVSVTGR